MARPISIMTSPFTGVCWNHKSKIVQSTLFFLIKPDFAIKYLKRKPICFSIDCVGILKLRNADVEQRIGIARSKKKSTRVRMVFRVAIPSADAALAPVILQAASTPISCSKLNEGRRNLNCLLDSCKHTHFCFYLYFLSELTVSFIVPAQPAGQPEVSKKSLSESSPQGGAELFVIGKNFLKQGAKVMFQEKDHNDTIIWQQKAELDQEHFQQVFSLF